LIIIARFSFFFVAEKEDAMFKIIAPVLAVSLWLFAGSASAEILINGAGATSPYPLYATWFSEYLKIDKDVKFNYQTIDSIGAVKEIIARTVDFGATDIFLSDEELKAAPGTVIHIPTIMMAEVVTYNLPGIGSGIKFPTELLADIYLGKITKWNDPKIAVCNPDIKLPDKAIIAVYRSDRSGTAIIFSDYLASVSEEWAAKVGKGGSIKWPVGLGAKGNEGVVAQVRSNPYAIGYVQCPMPLITSSPTPT
jgi:phosphate transport system substrate-binding protein